VRERLDEANVVQSNASDQQGGAGSSEPGAPRDSARVFVGIKLSAGIATELARVGRELERFQVKLVAASDMHLTLVPPWQESSIADTVEKLEQVAASFAAFPLLIEHVGYGPDPQRPHLMWADCAAADELQALRAALLMAYSRSEERAFRPHVTLARFRGNGRTIARKHPVDRLVSFNQQVQSVELFQSPPSGERGYRVLASVPLDTRKEQAVSVPRHET
jgi:RNA 2',3'-cyclic 3'-phosphodiesterase